ncbi:MAG: nuclear transport factor 2 family protein [Jatrophihabitans sp.]
MDLDQSDREQIRDLVTRYALLVDSRDYDGVAGLFVPQGVLVGPDPPRCLDPVRACTGRDEIRREIQRLDAFTLTFHAVVGQCLEKPSNLSEAPQVSAVVSCVAHHVHVSDDQARDLTWHLRYRDTYESDHDEWRFTRREISIDFIDVRPLKLGNVAQRVPRQPR